MWVILGSESSSKLKNNGKKLEFEFGSKIGLDFKFKLKNTMVKLLSMPKVDWQIQETQAQAWAPKEPELKLRFKYKTAKLLSMHYWC
jgi:hypothetical protein